MSVTRDINLGSLVPIGLFLFAQTAGAIWWAATISAQFEALQAFVVQDRAGLETRVNNVDQNRITDRQRLFDRLVQVERLTTELSASERATTEIVGAIKEDIGALREDLRENNSLLRDLLTDAKK